MQTETHNAFAFFGTPEFSVHILDVLEKHKLLPKLVITAPDKPRGRGNNVSPTPVKYWAEARNITTLTPNTMDDEVFLNALETSQCSVFIVAAYGFILPETILSIPEKGVLNIHPSLLPKYRGATPIQGALAAGEKETGVSIILMDEKMDHGPILAQKEIEIDSDDSSIELVEKLAMLSGELMSETYPKWLNEEIHPQEQNHAEATFTKLLKKSDGKINWNAPATNIVNSIRAHQIWPTSWTLMKENEKETRIKILRASTGTAESHTHQPGDVVMKSGGLAVATSDGWVKVELLKPEGKGAVTGAEFAATHAAAGTRFT